MKLLLVGEDREGGLLSSLAEGLSQLCETSITDPASILTRSIDQHRVSDRIRRRAASRNIDAAFLEAVEQLSPDAVLIVKGRGISGSSIEIARKSAPVALYYPDNPFWRFSDSREVLSRLASCDLVMMWSARIAENLRVTCRRVEVVPFGFDSRWFPLGDPGMERSGIVFLGTWHPRRQRYLSALEGLPVSVIGRGWDQMGDPIVAPPVYGTGAGAILRSAAIAINIYHPHNAGAHNMRTREIASSGALQLTDPGWDGTPLRDGDGCRWFSSPADLRTLADRYLMDSTAGTDIAYRGQELARMDTYGLRASEILSLVESLR